MNTALGAVVISMLAALAPANNGCGNQPTNDDIQREQQEKILQDGTSQIGMPAIVNFRERKILKDVYEKRDQAHYATYTYLYSDMKGKYVFFCNSIGYGIPYATQFTNPQKAEWVDNSGIYVLPQADPNGLFSPASAEGTWVMCKNPKGDDVSPVYVEPRIIVSPFELPDQTDTTSKK